MAFASADMVDSVYVLESVRIVELIDLFISLLVILPDNVSVKVLDLVVIAVPCTLSSIDDLTDAVAATIILEN